MNIRSMIPEDTADLKALYLEVHALHAANRPDIYAAAPEDPEAILRQILEDPNAFALTAEENGKPVGFCTVSMRTWSGDPTVLPRTTALLEVLSVAEGSRGCGIGTHLLEAAKTEAAKRGAVWLELMVWEFNDAAMAFYQKMGLTTRCRVLEAKL